MRNLKNTEIANYVSDEMNNKGYDISYSKILQMVDDSIEYDNDFEKDEFGEILNEMTELQIQNLKNAMLSGIEEYYSTLLERCA